MGRCTPLEPLLAESGGETRIGRFSGPQEGDYVDLTPLLEDAMQLRKEVPLELVVNMFHRLVGTTLSVDCDYLLICAAAVESAAHHVFAGGSIDGHDHKNGYCSLVDSTLSASRCPRRRYDYGQQIIIRSLFDERFRDGTDGVGPRDERR
jgi:hypothetical protein